MGKHYYLSVKGSEIYKPYTQLVSLSNEVIEYRENLLKLLDARQERIRDSDIESNQFHLESYSDELSFAIKPYRLRAGALSTKLVDISLGNPLKLKGPFGEGLNLTEDFSGRCVILCLGTGILPFLDLFDFLLKKAIYQIFKAERSESLLQYVKPEQNYESIMKNASFEMYASFHSSKDFIGADWVHRLHTLSQKYNLGLFKAVVNIGSMFEGPVSNFD